MKEVWEEIYDIIKTCKLNTSKINVIVGPMYRATRRSIIK